MDLKPILARNVSALRKSHSLSQEELAKLVNVTKQTIYRIESGSTSTTLDTLSKLASVLDVTASGLLADDSQRQRRRTTHQRRLEEIMDCLDKALSTARKYRASLND